MRRPRHLSPEDRAIWDSYRRQVDPLDRARDAAAPPAPLARPRDGVVLPPAARDPLPRFRVGQSVQDTARLDLVPSIGDRLKAAPVNMDHKSFGKMTRGKLTPEARIDLHGMTLDQAHPELIGFILNAQAAGKRLVLVITGKGKRRDEGGPMPARHGILRNYVPHWLSQPPLGPAILEVRSAHQRHGGSGAYYVYLRRRR